MSNILDFTKGDRIVRVQPAKSLGSMMSLNGIVLDRGGDRSYMGEELVFVGIANGQIYLQRSETSFGYQIFGDKLIDLPIDIWDEGWEKWVDPKMLLNDDVSMIIDIKTLKIRLKQAIADENYELAEKLKKQIEKQ